MRKFYLLLACISLLFAGSLISCQHQNHRAAISDENTVTEEEREHEEEGEENEEYDGPAQRDSLEFEKTKDPALGYVPYDRLLTAMSYTEASKHTALRPSAPFANLLWQERGPIYDSTGPSNGNTRGGNGYTSGRMAAIMIDTLNDPTGNTVFCGGIAGGLWKCTNFLSAIPNWQLVNDFFDNLAVYSICQDPTNSSIMYFTTGEATSNADAVLGAGIWKSTDKGVSWNRIPSTVTFIRSFKIICDAAGNVYLAARPTTTPVAQTAGMLRSKDKGASWTNITPSGLTGASAICTDIEISSTGRLHASFGYSTAGGVVNHRYTDDPANVTSASWNASTGIRSIASPPLAVRLELACMADTLYGVTVNTAYNADSCYKSIDGGVTWTKQTTATYPTGVLNGQGWYNLTVAINPTNASEIIVGGLDAYRSTNNGVTAPTRLTYWVTTSPYVHADHHFMQWWKSGTESRVVIGCDGGIFYSKDGGATWIDKNRNLGIKQFYAADIHPSAGSDYLIAGAQDNGCHQLKYPGLSYSYEVTGGDGCFVHINQKDPQVQFGSYVYNQYRRTLNGGATWSSVNLSTTLGMFVNPFTLDDNKNILYACWQANQIVRWTNAGTNATAVTNTLAFTGLGTPSAFKVSPYTADRLFIGSNSGKIFRLDHADVTTPASFATDLKDISGASFPAGFINCVNTGSSDDVLVATFTNYGVNNVWYSTNGGTSWTAIDGNLPDMPVRWALFKPGHDDQLILATEAGIYTTDAVNGSSTVWSANPGFPTVRTDMLKMRTSDNTIVAATHGRGLWTATIPTSAAPEVAFAASSLQVNELTVGTVGCRNYKDYVVNVGILNPPTGDATVTYNVQAGSTATRGSDFDFTTNGNFDNPSSQHVFTSGAVAVKPLTIRVYDDNQVESPETFTINFTISGTTNAVAGTQKTYTVTIGDNDFAPKPYLPVSYALGSYNADMDDLNTPFDGTKLKHRLQILITAGELKAAGIYSSANISSLKMRVKTKNTTIPFKGFTISMVNTTTSTLSAGFTGGTFTQVYTSDYSTVVGDNVFNFTNTFTWDGSSNIAVQFCFDNSSVGTPENLVDVVEGNSSPLGVGVRASTYSNHTTSGSAGCSLAAAFIDDYRLNPTLTATFGNKVATALNTSSVQTVNGNNDLYFYSATGDIIARIRNLSARSYGCTNVTIDRAGTASKPFWLSAAANNLMDKTFRIVPATNSDSGRYEVTFYYTKAEKEGWEAATGQSWNNIQLIKTANGPVSAITAANPMPDGRGTVQVVTPVRGTFGDDFTLAYTFDNSNFSGYGAGIPGNITTLLTLNGKWGTNTVLLDWTTTTEFKSTVFEMEKSYDGVNFRKIFTMNASGIKLTPTTYNAIDADKVQRMYYRVRMLHSDNYVVVSNTVMVENPNAPFRMFVIPNPFENDIIRVRFSHFLTGNIKFALYDAAGKQITFYETPAINGNPPYYSFPVAGTVSKTVYYLNVEAGGKRFAVRVMKK